MPRKSIGRRENLAFMLVSLYCAALGRTNERGHDFGRSPASATTRGIGGSRREAEEWSDLVAYGLDDQ